MAPVETSPGGSPRRRSTPIVREDALLTFPLLSCAFYVFIDYMRPQEKYALLSGIPMGGIAAALVVIAAVASKRGLSTGSAAGATAFLFLVWTGIASLLSPWPVEALLKYWEGLKTVAFMFFLIAAIRNPRQLYWFCCFVLLVYFIHTNFSFRDWAASGFSGAGAGAYVGSGFLHNPNDYGAALASFWGVSLALAVWDSSRYSKRISASLVHKFGTCLFLVAVLTSSSRGAAVAVLAGFLYFAFRYSPGSRKLFVLGVVALAAMAFWWLLSESQLQRFSNMGTAQDDTAQDRLRTWRAAWQVFQSSPVIGVGFGQFYHLAIGMGSDKPIFVQHNIFLQAMTESGLIGLGLLMATLMLFMREQSRIQSIRSDDPDMHRLQMLSRGFSISMVSFVVAGQFITVLFYPFLWLLMGLGISAYRMIPQPLRTRSQRTPTRYARPGAMRRH